MIDFANARAIMVDTQIRTEGVTDHDVLDAMADIPREFSWRRRRVPLPISTTISW